jgi:hypothetical protein
MIMLKSKFLLTSFAAGLGSTLIGLMFATSASAQVTEPVDVQVAFVAPITITETNPLEFGSLDVAMGVGEQVIIATDNTPTDAAANIVGGVQASAKLTVTATGGRPINILVDTVGDGVFYNLTAWRCDYNGAADGACDGLGLSQISFGGGSAQVRVGATLTSLGGAGAGDDDGSFNLTVAYE